MISVIAEIAIITEFWSRLSAVGGASPWPGGAFAFGQAPQDFTTKSQRTQIVFKKTFVLLCALSAFVVI
jgi:hypothetical protein